MNNANPPHNPAIRDLISGKRQLHYRQSSNDGSLGFRGWHERGRLPHLDAPDRVQFVTFRLADSFPESRRSEWESLFNLENDRERKKQLEEYLDRNHGEAHLRVPEVGTIVEDALRYFDRERYHLRAWVIMPNHVHTLLKIGQTPLSEIIESWKSFTAKRANKILGRTGRFWQPDYWDTYMRDDNHEAKTIRYIENNPAKAKLVSDPKDWPWTSARFREQLDRSAAILAASSNEASNSLIFQRQPRSIQLLRPEQSRSNPV